MAVSRPVVQGVGKRKEGSVWEWARVVRRLSAAWSRTTRDRRVSWVPAPTTRGAQASGRFRWRARGMRGITTGAGVAAAMRLSPLRVV